MDLAIGVTVTGLFDISVNPSINQDGPTESGERESTVDISVKQTIATSVTSDPKYVKNISKPLRRISLPARRVNKISSSNKLAILRGKCRTRRQLENVSNCFRLPRLKINDPIRNQIEIDLELTEEYNLNGRSKLSLAHYMSRDNNVVFQSKSNSVQTPGSSWCHSKITFDIEEKTISISPSSDTATNLVINIDQVCLVKVGDTRIQK